MFATTKALAFLRSAELARSVKNLFLRPEEFETFACAFGQTPSPIRVLPLIQEGEFFLILNSLRRYSLKLLPFKGRWIQARLAIESGGVFLAEKMLLPYDKNRQRPPPAKPHKLGTPLES